MNLLSIILPLLGLPLFVCLSVCLSVCVSAKFNKSLFYVKMPPHPPQSAYAATVTAYKSRSYIKSSKIVVLDLEEAINDFF